MTLFPPYPLNSSGHSQPFGQMQNPPYYFVLFITNVNLQIDLKTIETIYLNTQGQCLTTPNSFTTILIYHYSDFFDDLKNDQFLLRISVSLGFFACTLAYMSIISLFRALDMEGSAFTQLSTLDGIWLGKGTWWKTQDWNLFEIPLGLRAVHLQVAPQHVHTGIVNSPGTLQCIATWSSLMIWDDWASPDRTVIILAVKDEEVDHEHVDGEVGEDVALVAVHQLQQLAPGLVRAGQVLQHRLARHPLYISVPLLTRHLYEFLATSQSGANCSFEEKHNICQAPLVTIELNAFH